MSKLYFRYGAMNSGKSMSIAMVAFNYSEQGMNVLVIKPGIDTKSPQVLSRAGITRKVDFIVNENETKLREKLLKLTGPENKKIDCVLVDEAQFLTRQQVNELYNLAVIDDIPVICYGLRTDFASNMFTGSKRLMELAHSIEENKTICKCGKKAVFNSRIVDGQYTLEGNAVAIDGEVNYESKCGVCYIRDVRLGEPF